jgi:ankyrin repeat protein
MTLKQEFFAVSDTEGHEDPSREEIEAFLQAAGEGKQAKVSWFLDKHPEYIEEKEKDPHYGKTALIKAAQNDHFATVKLLVARDADIHGRGNDGFTALMSAAYAGHKDITTWLLKQGAAVDEMDNFYHRTALMWSTMRDYPEVTKILLDNGADVNRKDICEKQEWSVLIGAAYYGQTENVKLLLDAGALVDEKDTYGWTALMHAADHNQIEVARQLLQAGASFENKSTGEAGQTALLCAATSGNADIVEMLLERGADINAKDNWGQTALEVAQACLKGAEELKDKHEDRTEKYLKTIAVLEGWPAVLAAKVEAEHHAWLATTNFQKGLSKPMAAPKPIKLKPPQKP